MKKYANTFLALLIASAFIGCNSSNSTKTTEKTNATTPVVNEEESTPPAQTETQKQIMPQCYITEGIPKTESSVVVHVKCRNGNIHIDEATVTVDKKVKSVDYNGVGFNDYIGFKYLQPDTRYKVQLEVVVGGETITKSVKIRTKKEVVKVTPTPTPIIDSTPQWTKDSYEIGFRSLTFPLNRIILDLNKLCLAKGDIIYKIVSSHLQQNTIPQDSDYNLENELTIDNGKLKLDNMPYNGGLVIVNIRATSNHKSSDTSVKITLEPLYLP